MSAHDPGRHGEKGAHVRPRHAQDRATGTGTGSLGATTDGLGIFYVMGPSGSGKDSLLRALQHRLDPTDRIIVAHRYITRASDANEASVALSEDEFERRSALGCFALQWRSHGLRYGVGIEIEAWLADGIKVVVNGSREYLPVALARYPGLCAVRVHVATDVLAARLHQRGRESADAIARRLERAAQPFTVPAGCRLVEVDNSGALDGSADRFIALVRSDTTAPQLPGGPDGTGQWLSLT
jgi:ribose 1,5-bisphosphokinase